jgi:Transcriptional regulator, AbiEi antitoxin
MRPLDGSLSEIAWIAARQHGVITRQQLIRAGLSEAAVQRRLRTGSLLPAHRGVYRVGHQAPGVEASYLAAVLACGDGAVLNGTAAAYLFVLVKGGAPPPEVAALRNRRIAGVLTHRVRELHPRDVSVYRGIPITTVPRTVVDLAGRLSAQALARACHEAEVRHGVKREAIAAVLRRRPGAAGAAKLRAVFDGSTPILLSRLEAAFLTQLKQAGLPLPKTNRPAGLTTSTAAGPSGG